MATTSIVQARRSRATVGFIAAGACTAVAGAVLLFGLQPVTDVSDDMWRYPWSSSGAFVAFSVFSAALHGMVIAGLLALSAAAAQPDDPEPRRAAWRSPIAGTALLLVGELASIPIRDAEVDDTSAVIVGAIFGVGGIASTVGFLLTGWATVRAAVWHGWRRFTPLAVGLWLVVLTPVTLAAPTLLHGGVGVYGLCLLAMAIALHTEPTPAVDSDPVTAGIPGVEHQLERA